MYSVRHRGNDRQHTVLRLGEALTGLVLSVFKTVSNRMENIFRHKITYSTFSKIQHKLINNPPSQIICVFAIYHTFIYCQSYIFYPCFTCTTIKSLFMKWIQVTTTRLANYQKVTCSNIILNQMFLCNLFILPDFDTVTLRLARFR